jgi:hypothetical protein
MRGRSSVSFSLFNETRRLVNVTKWVECKRVKITSGNAVVLAEAVRNIAMERTIIKVERLLKMVMSAPIVSQIPTGGAENAMSYKSLKQMWLVFDLPQETVTGCETDVCVLQSCLGLLSLGYEVFVVENLIFSSARNVDAAIARMKAAGATFLAYKSLVYELTETVDALQSLETSRRVTKDLPE